MHIPNRIEWHMHVLILCPSAQNQPMGTGLENPTPKTSSKRPFFQLIVEDFFDPG